MCSEYPREDYSRNATSKFNFHKAVWDMHSNSCKDCPRTVDVQLERKILTNNTI